MITYEELMSLSIPNKETKEESMKRKCEKFCPHLFKVCFEFNCYFNYRFY